MLKDNVARLEAEVETLKMLVLRLAVAAVDPTEFDDVDAYVIKIFEFAETNLDTDPASEAEIDEFTSIMVEEYDFDDFDVEADEDVDEDGVDGKEGIVNG